MTCSGARELIDGRECSGAGQADVGDRAAGRGLGAIEPGRELLKAPREREEELGQMIAHADRPLVLIRCERCAAEAERTSRDATPKPQYALTILSAVATGTI